MLNQCLEKNYGVLYAFDAEDFHRSKDDEGESNSEKIIEDIYFPGAAYITAASTLIADEYKKNYPRIEFAVINNVFSKKQQPSFKQISNQPLKLFWFSQTVGLRRGLQDIIAAINLLNHFPIELTILGYAGENIKKILGSLLTNDHHQINFMPPCDEEELIRISSLHHIGLALEPGFSLNNKIALSNKLFTYLLAGNAVILSGTPAQQLFYKQYPQVGWCYQQPSHSQVLASIIDQAYKEPAMLNSKRQAAWHLADTQLNWEIEQQRFLQMVKNII